MINGDPVDAADQLEGGDPHRNLLTAASALARALPGNLRATPAVTQSYQRCLLEFAQQVQTLVRQAQQVTQAHRSARAAAR